VVLDIHSSPTDAGFLNPLGRFNTTGSSGLLSLRKWTGAGPTSSTPYHDPAQRVFGRSQTFIHLAALPATTKRVPQIEDRPPACFALQFASPAARDHKD
jgi:hypothetical protein